jgi:hypothetical protein
LAPALFQRLSSAVADGARKGFTRPADGETIHTNGPSHTAEDRRYPRRLPH